MIEKLKPTLKGFDDKPQMPTATEFLDKINELCDTVNELQKQIDKVSCAILDLATPDGENKALESIQVEPPTDPYAEQRKWIGKICKFWDIDNDNLYYGPLTKIHDTSPYCYECNHKMCYANCEPVSEDLIYKGGDDE